jgi:hypothetical protein
MSDESTVSDERAYYESIRRKANRARKRLTAMLERSSIAAGREALAERGTPPDSSGTRPGGERRVR